MIVAGYEQYNINNVVSVNFYITHPHIYYTRGLSAWVHSIAHAWRTCIFLSYQKLSLIEYLIVLTKDSKLTSDLAMLEREVQ